MKAPSRSRSPTDRERVIGRRQFSVSVPGHCNTGTVLTSQAKAAVAAAVESAREQRRAAPQNDPLAFDAAQTAIVRLERLRQRLKSASVDDSVIEALLLQAANALPGVAGCSPGRTYMLAYTAWRLSGLQELHAFAVEQMDAIPHPPYPEWPEAVHHVPSGLPRACRAFQDLHEHGWGGASRHYDGALKASSMNEAMLWIDAKTAFAQLCAGPSAVHDCYWTHIHATRRLEGSYTALKMLRPPQEWSAHEWGSREQTWLSSVCVELMKLKDWEAAMAVTELIRSRPDLLDEATERGLSSREARIRKQLLNTTSVSPDVPAAPGTSFSRPSALSRRVAPARPAVAQAVVDAAESGDPTAVAFLAELGDEEGRRRLSVDPSLRLGHLFLLFEYDEQAVNGKIARHEAADDELVTALIWQGRHGNKGSPPRLSGYVIEAAIVRPHLTPVVVRTALDPDLLAPVLAVRAHRATKNDIAYLVLRTLDMPTGRATAILNAVQRHVSPMLDQDMRSAIDRAYVDASGADAEVDVSALRAELEKAAAVTSQQALADTGRGRETAEALRNQLRSVRTRVRAKEILRAADGPLPWAELVEAFTEGSLGRGPAEALVELKAPPAMLRAFVTQYGDTSDAIYDAADHRPVRWLTALLEAPLPLDDASRAWRTTLAKRLLPSNQAPMELLTRLPDTELAEAAEHAISQQPVFAEGRTPLPAWQNLARISREGPTDLARALMSRPLQEAIRIARFLEGGSLDSGSSTTLESLPPSLRSWLRETCRGQDGSVMLEVERLLPSWTDSLYDLLIAVLPDEDEDDEDDDDEAAEDSEDEGGETER